MSAHAFILHFRQSSELIDVQKDSTMKREVMQKVLMPHKTLGGRRD